MAAGGSSTAVLAAFFGSSAVAATTLVAYLFTRTSSMPAGSIHSLAGAVDGVEEAAARARIPHARPMYIAPDLLPPVDPGRVVSVD